MDNNQLEDNNQLDMAHLVRQHGMTKILEQLVAHLDGPEPYVVRLRDDLARTLERYKMRYVFDASPDG